MKDKLNEFVGNNKKNILIGFAILVIGIGYLYSNTMNINNTSDKNIFEDTEVAKKDVEINKNTKSGNNYIYIDIQGSVKVPGIYKLSKSARVFNAIQAASGLLDNADRKNINQDKKITDQEKIYIPMKGEIQEKQNVENQVLQDSQKMDSDEVEKININAATVEELQKLSGVGPKKAEQIVEYRNTSGNFDEIEDLTKVSGIGEKTLEALKSKITV